MKQHPEHERWWNKSGIMAVLTLLVMILVHQLWFFGLGSITYSDAHNIPLESYAQKGAFVWDSHNTGTAERMPNHTMYYVLLSAASKLMLWFDASHGTDILQRIFYYWPIVIVGTLSAFYLIVHITRKPVAAAIGTLVFNLNSMMIVAAGGHILIALGFALAPLVLHRFLILFEKQRVRDAVLCAIVLFVAGIVELRVAYVMCWAVFLLFLYWLVITYRDINVRRFIARFALAVGIFVLLSAYWMVPFFSMSSDLVGRSFGLGIFRGPLPVSSHLLQALALADPAWSGGRIVTFSTNAVPISFFVIPLVAFAALLIRSGDRNRGRLAVFFALLALFGLLLCKFYFPPFDGLYTWLYQHWLGFDAFREPSKFQVLIFLPYAVLVGFVVTELTESRRKIIAAVVGVVVVAVMLQNAIPLMSGTAGSTYVERNIPNDYVVLRDFLKTDQSFGRVLWMPTWTRWSTHSRTHASVSGAEMIGDRWNEYATNETAWQDKIRSVLTGPAGHGVLSASAITYVVIPMVDAKNEENVFAGVGNSSAFFSQALDNVSYLHRIDIGTSDVIVYAADNPRPHIYFTDADNPATSKFAAARVVGDTPTSYEVETRTASQYRYLVLSEGFSDGWRVAKGSPGFLSRLFGTQVIKTAHTNRLGVNVFEMPDGPPSTLTLYYYPQVLMELGFFITIITATLCVVFLVVRRRERL